MQRGSLYKARRRDSKILLHVTCVGLRGSFPWIVKHYRGNRRQKPLYKTTFQDKSESFPNYPVRNDKNRDVNSKLIELQWTIGIEYDLASGSRVTCTWQLDNRLPLYYYGSTLFVRYNDLNCQVFSGCQRCVLRSWVGGEVDVAKINAAYNLVSIVRNARLPWRTHARTRTRKPSQTHNSSSSTSTETDCVSSKYCNYY